MIWEGRRGLTAGSCCARLRGRARGLRLDMALRLFNTLTRSVQEFVPLDPAGQVVRLYC